MIIRFEFETQFTDFKRIKSEAWQIARALATHEPPVEDLVSVAVEVDFGQYGGGSLKRSGRTVKVSVEMDVDT